MTAGRAPERSRRRLVGVLGANAAAWSATRLLAVAVPWFVLSTTGSATATGLIVFAQMAPYVIVQMLAGPLIDRIGARRVSIVCDLIAVVAMAAAPTLYVTVGLPLWTLMLVMAVVGAADGPSNIAKGVFVPEATRAAGVPIERGTGLVGAIERTATTIGPALAGLVVAGFGSPAAFWVTAALFAAGAAIVAATQPSGRVAVVAEPEPYRARFRAGTAFLRNEPLLRSIVAMVAVTNLLDQAVMAILLPVWARRHDYGPAVIGLLISAFGAASIIASLIAARVGERLNRRRAYVIGFVIGGLPRFAALALGLPVWAVVAVFAAGGLGSGFVNPIIGAVTYQRIPAAILGRVRSLTQALSYSGIPFGGLAGGAAIAVAGMPGAIWLIGAAYLVAILLPARRADWAEPAAGVPGVVPAPRSAESADATATVGA